ncbi:nucleotidyl transferase AbiEii/AbiGii toxin family protein [Microcystis elabens FACHB-917]|nr:nucleotidyl transferase AbiEii/AbiGii toxin family protein [Microcystis elabens FACHB-917]
MAEVWFALSAEDQKEALAVAAAESGWPAYLLEKDIWVVWALQILGTDQQLLQSLTFKGGTSLSKAHGLIDRFSEDVDLTLNIQRLWPEVVLAPAANPSQADKRRRTADRRLRQWVQEMPLPLLQGAVVATGQPVELTLQATEPGRRLPTTIVLRYPPLIRAPEGTHGYVRPTVLLEFGAHSTGQPHGLMPITCEAATHLAMLDFPTARPLVMDPKRTFLEKAAAIHVSCRKGRWGSGEGDRYSRHWYDLDRLAQAGIAEAAVRDRPLCEEVAQHKEDFWRARDADEQPIDYLHALSRNLQLVPTDEARQALEADFQAMTDSGMLRGEIPSFAELLERISQLEAQCNAIAWSLA